MPKDKFFENLARRYIWMEEGWTTAGLFMFCRSLLYSVGIYLPRSCLMKGRPVAGNDCVQRVDCSQDTVYALLYLFPTRASRSNVAHTLERKVDGSIYNATELSVLFRRIFTGCAKLRNLVHEPADSGHE